MAFWQPRSVLQLVLGGFFVALVPLCVAILFAVMALGELSTQNRVVSRQVVDIIRLGQAVETNVLEIERRSRQYFALGDPNLAELFYKERTKLLQQLQSIQELVPTDGPDLKRLQGAIDKLGLEVSEELGEESRAGDRLEQSFAVINVQSEAVKAWLQSSVDQILARHAAQAQTVTDSLLWLVSLLALATLALLLVFANWINRPVKDLTEEIHQLGTAGLSHSIEISGPSELQVLGTKLEWLRSRLHETDQQKQQFLRHISHELKTPLASLREGAELLAEQVSGRLSQQQREIVEIVRQNGIELQRLIENLLDYNQLPNQELKVREFDPGSMLRGMVEAYRISIDKRALELKLTGNLSTWSADPQKLKTTVDNLLSNAVNYTSEGGQIDVAWYQNNANLIIEVANSGDSIPEQDIPHLFEPFFQSAARRKGPIKGSGIGLSVARECIEVQGGSLELVSHPHLPVCFRLSCPLC